MWGVRPATSRTSDCLLGAVALISLGSPPPDKRDRSPPSVLHCAAEGMPPEASDPSKQGSNPLPTRPAHQPFVEDSVALP